MMASFERRGAGAAAVRGGHARPAGSATARLRTLCAAWGCMLSGLRSLPQSNRARMRCESRLSRVAGRAPEYMIPERGRDAEVTPRLAGTVMQGMPALAPTQPGAAAAPVVYGVVGDGISDISDQK